MRHQGLYNRVFFFILLIIFALTAKAQKNNQYIDYMLEKYVIVTDNGKSLEMYSIGNLHEAGMYDRTFGNFLHPGGLKNYEDRIRSYERILIKLAFQTEFDLTVINKEIQNEMNCSDAEFISLLETTSVTSEIAIEFAKIISQYSNLKYIKNTNHIAVVNNKLKALGRGIRAGSFENFSAALSIVSIGLNTASVINNAAIINETALLMKAAQLDKGILILEYIRDNIQFDDNAFQEALSETLINLKSTPDSYWGQLSNSILIHQTELENGVISFAQLVNDVLVLNSSIGNLGTPNPIFGWISAVLFTIDTYNMTVDWNLSLRDAATAATLYKAVLSSTLDSQNAKSIWISDYLQFLFLDCMEKVLSNNYLTIWELIKPGQKETRIYFAQEKQGMRKVVIEKRLKPVLNNLLSNSGNIKIGFILDSSGSMAENDPHEIRKSGVEQVLHLIDPADDVFLIDFDNYSRWLNPANWNSWDLQSLIKNISNIDSDGGTNVGLGLSTMQQALESSGVDFSNTGIVLLTDGKGEYNQQADWFSQKGIPVYTISYLDKADASLLNNISQATNGIYNQADNEDDVVAAFMAFYTRLKSNSRFVSIVDEVPPGQFSDHFFNVDPGTSDLIVNLNWRINFLNFSLTTPSGKLLNEGNSLLNISAGNGYKIIKCLKPESGKWRIRLTSSNNSSVPTPFMIDISGNSPIFIDLIGGLSANRMINYRIDDKKQALDLNKSTAKISVTTPKSGPIDISNRFNQGQFTYIPTEGEGNYKFDVTIYGYDKSGNPVQRVFQRSTLLGEGFMPGFISTVQRIMGGYVYSDQGSNSGNRVGMKCYIYEPGKTRDHAKAIGYVTNVSEGKCTIEISQTLKTIPIRMNDVIELDVSQWMKD